MPNQSTRSDLESQEVPKPDKAWFNSLSYVLGLAMVAVLISSSALIYVAFKNSWGSFGQNRGEVILDNTSGGYKADIVDGIHIPTGLIVARGFSAVKSNCTNCHSAKLVTQNRASREGWSETINWMQETQGLWELGSAERLILDYLATNYGPQDYGRRANLSVDSTDWYILDLH